MNLFLALLLASFGSNVLIDKEDDENKIGEAIDRIQRFSRFLIKSMVRVFRRENPEQENDAAIQNTTDEAIAHEQV